MLPCTSDNTIAPDCGDVAWNRMSRTGKSRLMVVQDKQLLGRLLKYSSSPRRKPGSRSNSRRKDECKSLSEFFHDPLGMLSLSDLMQYLVLKFYLERGSR